MAYTIKHSLIHACFDADRHKKNGLIGIMRRLSFSVHDAMDLERAEQHLITP